jgi:hypothetical protein
MNPDLRLVLLCAAGLFVLVYVVPVFQLKTAHHAGARLRLAATSRERVEPRFLAVIDPLIAALNRLGFTLVGFLDGPGDPAKASGIRHTVVLRTGDGVTGAIIYLIEKVTPEAVRLTTGVEFSTEFADGGSNDTSNSSQPSLFRYPANRRVRRFPGVTDLAELYDLHRRLVARAGAVAVKPLVETLEGTVRRIQESGVRDMAYQVHVGNYAPLSGGGYGHTWKGAVRAVAILGAGVKGLGQARQRRDAAALAAELRRDPPPP